MKIVKPNRIIHSYVQTIEGTPEEILPLYCPVKEILWCEDWEPTVVYSKSGLVEPECVFITEDNEIESAWFVTVHDIKQGRVEMIKHTPGVTISKLEITTEPISDLTTRVTVTYGFTSLSKAGDDVLKEFTEENYNISMDAWEKAMNYYLKTGEMLTGLAKF